MSFSEFVDMQQEEKMRCPVCGKEIRSEARFCGYCGSPLDSARNIGKEKCEYLKSVRDRIAKENNIPYMSKPCTSTAPCEGICPACEAETAALRRMLEAKGAGGDTIIYGNDAWDALSVSDDNIRQTSLRDEWNERPMGYMKGPAEPPVWNTERKPVEPERLAGIPANRNWPEEIPDEQEELERIRFNHEETPGIPADPNRSVGVPGEPIPPKKKSFLQRIKKAFGK